MGLRGVFISKGHVCGHSTFLGTKDDEAAGWFMLPEPKQDFLSWWEGFILSVVGKNSLLPPVKCT